MPLELLLVRRPSLLEAVDRMQSVIAQRLIANILLGDDGTLSLLHVALISLPTGERMLAKCLNLSMLHPFPRGMILDEPTTGGCLALDDLTRIQPVVSLYKRRNAFRYLQIEVA